MPKILIVEDSAEIAQVVRHHVEGAGYQTITAGDVEEAWRQLVTESPDAAVVDVKLPGAVGWSLLERIRRDGRFQSMPAVALTGLLDQETVDRAAAYGCEYLSKPFSAPALLNKLRVVMAQIVARPPERPAAAGGVNRVDLVPVGVTLLLDAVQVAGVIHLPPELERFSEAWESVINDPRTFLPVTDVTLRTLEGTGMIASATFVEVRKTDIRAAYPREQPVSGPPPPA